MNFNLLYHNEVDEQNSMADKWRKTFINLVILMIPLAKM